MIDFKKLPSSSIHGDGIQYIFKADNRYGASIVQHDFSRGANKGLWELAVVKYDKPIEDETSWGICYPAPLTDDVLGYLNDEEVNEILDKISKL